MNKFMKKLLSPKGTIAMFALSGVLLAGSAIGGIRAALTYFSETYSSRVEMYDIGISLLENGERVSWRDYRENSDGEWDEATGVLLENMLDTEGGEKLKLGNSYPEEISVRNSGTINEYVRVSIYKYWMKNGNKMQSLSPSLIRLHLLGDQDSEDGLMSSSDSGWLWDRNASTDERTVLYYNELLYADNEENRAAGRTIETPALSDTLTINGLVADKVTETKEERDEGGVHYTTITTTYDYNGVQFVVEAEVDAVQEHNAQNAAWSAWGRRINIGDDGTLSLAD